MAYNSMQAMFEGLEPYSLSGVTITDQELGRGSYATILELDYLGLKCAGKKIHEILLEQEENSTIYAIRRFKDECQILSQVRHPNIVQFLGVFFQQGDRIPLLVMEFLPLNLDQCLDRHNLPNEMRYSILHDVALGLHYLHSQQSPVVHRDLSSNNVLLTSNMRAKISDLGVARILNLSPQKITHLTKAPGTPAFMPPEVMVANPKYDTSMDVFSYGILMIHTFCGKMPIPQIESIHTEGDRLIPVSEAERRESFLKAIGKDHPSMELILKCIHNNPRMRANTSEIVSQLADMVEQYPIQFTNQLDMMEYISQLEEKEQTEVKTLLCTIEKAIDDFKTSLTDEVKRAMNHADQSNSREFDELICVQELKRVESHSVSSKSFSLHQQRRYENYTFLTCGQKDSIKAKHTRTVSDVLPTSIKYDSKLEDTKQEATLQAINQDLKPQSTDEINGDKASKKLNDEQIQKHSPISLAVNTSLKPTESTEHTIDSHPNRRPKAIRYSSKPTTEETKHKSMSATSVYQHKPVLQRSKTSNWITHGEKSAAVNVGSVSAPKQPRRGQESPSILPKTHITSSKKEMFKDKGWKDLSLDSNAPKWKVTSSKQKVTSQCLWLNSCYSIIACTHTRETKTNLACKILQLNLLNLGHLKIRCPTIPKSQ